MDTQMILGLLTSSMAIDYVHLLDRQLFCNLVRQRELRAQDEPEFRRPVGQEALAHTPRV